MKEMKISKLKIEFKETIKDLIDNKEMICMLEMLIKMIDFNKEDLIRKKDRKLIDLIKWLNPLIVLKRKKSPNSYRIIWHLKTFLSKTIKDKLW